MLSENRLDPKCSIFAVADYLDATSYPLTSSTAIGYALTKLGNIAGKGFACLMLLDKKRRHIKTVRLKWRGHTMSTTVSDAVERAVTDSGAAYFVIAHNHHNKPLIPSSADRITTRFIRTKYLDSDVVFLDHYIVSGDDYITLIHRADSHVRYDSTGRTDHTHENL